MWETWEVRCLMLLSLLIQTSLTFLAPFRKRVSRACLKTTIWTLYLLADAVAIYVIGLISRDNSKFAQKPELLALWAPFLLLHLGGPDTITAFALEDNELWRRHALQLSFQVILTLRVFGRSLHHNAANNRLWLPTLLMFVDGFIKYFERTRALYYSSKDNFRESIMMVQRLLPNYDRLVEEYYSAKSANLPTEIHYYDDTPHVNVAMVRHGDDGDTHLNNKQGDGGDTLNDETYEALMIQNAYRFYEMCKPLLADGVLTIKDRRVNRSFFLSKTIGDAFMIIHIELNLIYDAFFTKTFLLQSRVAGYVRVLCFVFVIAAFVLFYVEWDLRADETDAILTIILFSGAITLDICAFFMFIMSDWWVIILNTIKESCILSLMKRVRRLKRNRFSKRWSKAIYSFNLLEFCFKKHSFSRISCKPFSKIKYVKDFCIGLFCVENKEAREELLLFVFSNIFEKAYQASDVKVAKEVFNARGDLVFEDDYYLVSAFLSPWTVDVEYDESVLLWHIATDLCYHTVDTEGSNEITETKEYRFCKEISDYMLYLIIRQPSLLSSVTGMADIRFHDTCEEAIKDISWPPSLLSFFKCMANIRFPDTCKEAVKSIKKHETKARSFYEHVMSKAIVEPMISKHKRSKSVWYNAVLLAKQLKSFGKHHQWVIMSKVWVELLCYAAVRCSPRSHIAQLNNGGELITLVWLFMAHLGLGERYLQADEYGWNHRLDIHK